MEKSLMAIGLCCVLVPDRERSIFDVLDIRPHSCDDAEHIARFDSVD